MEKENQAVNRLTQVHLEKWPLKCVCVSDTSAVVHVEPTTNVG